MIFADLELARRLERPEAISGARFVEARRRLSPDSGAEWIEVKVDGIPCVLDYTLLDGVMTITHTGVPIPISENDKISSPRITVFEISTVRYPKYARMRGIVIFRLIAAIAMTTDRRRPA